MKKEKIVMLISAILLILVIGLIIILNISYFKRIDYAEIKEKIDNKESFVLVITKTDCTHCASYKPKVEDVAKKYRINIYYVEEDLLSDEELQEFQKIISFSGTPTTVFIIDGEEKTAANRVNGDASKEKLINKLKSNGFIK